MSNLFFLSVSIKVKENFIVTVILSKHLSCIILHDTLFQSSYKTINYLKTFSYVTFVIWKTKRNVTHSNWNILNVKLEIQSKELHKDMYKMQICFWSFNFLHFKRLLMNWYWWRFTISYIINNGYVLLYCNHAISAFTVYIKVYYKPLLYMSTWGMKSPGTLCLI